MNDNKSEMIAFRTEWKGFNKQDVFRYIEKLSQQFDNQEKCYLAKIHSLESELSAASEEKVEQKSVTDDESAERITEKEAEIATLRSEKQALAEQVEQLTKKSEVLLESGKEEGITEEQYSYQIGNIMFRAGLEADRIIAEARTKAADLISEAQRQAEKTKAEAADQAKAMTEKTGEKCSMAANRYANDMKRLSNDTSAAYLSLCEHLTRQIAALDDDLKRHMEG